MTPRLQVDLNIYDRTDTSRPSWSYSKCRASNAVKYHVANILQKLELSRRNELRQWTGVRRDSSLFKDEPTMNGGL